MKLKDLNALFLFELRDLYSAEKQLTKACRRWRKARHERGPAAVLRGTPEGNRDADQAARRRVCGIGGQPARAESAPRWKG